MYEYVKGKRYQPQTEDAKGKRPLSCSIQNLVDGLDSSHRWSSFPTSTHIVCYWQFPFVLRELEPFDSYTDTPKHHSGEELKMMNIPYLLFSLPPSLFYFCLIIYCLVTTEVIQPNRTFLIYKIQNILLRQIYNSC